jgi:uncharacterized membrane protein YeaQ/YmgE (transglycosylase-associated protein family)
MVIIDLMTSLMGVRMGFLAFLLIGGASGASAWVLFPGRTRGSQNSNAGGFLIGVLLGFIAAAGGSYLGQYTGFFQSGQMLEWLAAILASCTIGCIYTALVK